MNHINATRPTVGSPEEPPDNTIITEATITKRKNKKRIPSWLHDCIVSECGNSDVKTGKSRKMDPALRLYKGAPCMVNTNDDLNEGRGNGTLCRCTRVQLKPNAKVYWKNWDGKKVNHVSVDDVDWVEFEHWPKPPKNFKRLFKLKPDSVAVTISLCPASGCRPIDWEGATITQFPVNTNIATTGHKLQGMSKDKLIVVSWNYGIPNWVYVVLSRVRTLEGLYLCTPLDLKKQFKVSEELLSYEKRLREKEERILDRRRNRIVTSV